MRRSAPGGRLKGLSSVAAQLAPVTAAPLKLCSGKVRGGGLCPPSFCSSRGHAPSVTHFARQLLSALWDPRLVMDVPEGTQLTLRFDEQYVPETVKLFELPADVLASLRPGEK